MASEAQPQKAPLPLILLLFLLLVVAILVLPSLKMPINATVQRGGDGQCQSAGQNFDFQQEAFTLAQTVEQYRRAHPFGGNYGLGSYTICYNDGMQQRFPSPAFKGYDNKNDRTNPLNATHSEQATYGWLQNQLSRLIIDQGKVTAIYAVIFSQVAVCPPCQKNMKSWQRTLRQKAHSSILLLSIWELPLGKGFDPAIYPAGTGQPVMIDDVEEVPIDFDP